VLRNKKKQVRFVKHHLPGGLRPEITVNANPVVLLPSKLFKEERLKRSAEADLLEGALAKELSNPEGHYAHWG
jgi:hypothetical protein